MPRRRRSTSRHEAPLVDAGLVAAVEEPRVGVLIVVGADVEEAEELKWRKGSASKGKARRTERKAHLAAAVPPPAPAEPNEDDDDPAVVVTLTFPPPPANEEDEDGDDDDEVTEATEFWLAAVVEEVETVLEELDEVDEAPGNDTPTVTAGRETVMPSPPVEVVAEVVNVVAVELSATVLVRGEEDAELEVLFEVLEEKETEAALEVVEVGRAVVVGAIVVDDVALEEVVVVELQREECKRRKAEGRRRKTNDEAPTPVVTPGRVPLVLDPAAKGELVELLAELVPG